jgi:3-methyladenine DNA glycosylase AlkD
MPRLIHNSKFIIRDSRAIVYIVITNIKILVRMINPFHKEILNLIQENSGKPLRDSFLNSYLGNTHIRYPITAPVLRIIAREWMRTHRDLSAGDFAETLTSLIEAESSTEKITAGILMGYSAKSQRTFDPAIFGKWLDHLVGWAEVDALCTGDFPITQLPADWPKWKKLIVALSKDANINKRRASLVLFCSPVGRVRDVRLADEAFRRIEKLKSEKEIMITKAVSWVLRSMTRHYRTEVSDYLDDNAATLPKIAVRETRVKLDTGTKTRKR